MESKYKNYFTVVYKNGEVRKLSSAEEVLLPSNAEVKFIIFSTYSHSSKQEFGNYYLHKLYDEFNRPVADNTFEWDGIRCRLYEEEHWGDIKSIWVVLKADIWDMLGNLETKKYENVHHTGRGFAELFDYINKLQKMATHEAYKFANDIIIAKDKELTELKQNIENK